MDLGRYGFRHDPMEWARSDDSLHAAWVRSIILGQPKPEDADIVAVEIGRILAQQKPDGHIDGDEQTPGALMRLLDLGWPADRPEFQRALTAMHDKAVAEDGRLKVYELHIACRAGWPDRDELKASAEALNEMV
ncbi:MAG: hypothetical protein HN849_17515, partial [Victivallales bacterium]|nr:hypothetical protein [Victivallales bacterium]